jgi:hypothetical protein
MLQSIRIKGEAVLRKFVDIGIIIGLVVLTLLTLALFSFLAVDLSVTAGGSIPRIPDWICRNALLLLGRDSAPQGGAYFREVSSVLSILLAVITVWFAVLPWLQFLKYRRNVREASVVDVTEVETVGKDDLETMRRYYENAEHITIFSGDFDFIVKHDGLRTALERLASSNKTPQEIENAMKNCGNVLDALRPCFRFHDRKFKFSFIQHRQGQSSFLSLVPGAKAGSNANLGVYGGKSVHASALVHIVQNICNIDACKQLASWDKKKSNAS